MPFWVKDLPPHTVAGDGFQLFGPRQHFFAPFAARFRVLQLARVRVWVKLSPAHTVSRPGDQEVGSQVGQRLLPGTVLVDSGFVPPTQFAVILVTLRFWLTRWPLQVEAGLGDQLPVRHRQVGGQFLVPVADLDDSGFVPPSQWDVIFLTLRVCMNGSPAHTVDRPGFQVPVLH